MTAASPNEMSEACYHAFLGVLLCADPRPIDMTKMEALQNWDDEEARLRGYEDWIAALHEGPTV